MTFYSSNKRGEKACACTGSSRPKVAIFGAGISGLTVAHNCIKRGFEVSVYDKELYTGGKCIGTVDEGGGFMNLLIGSSSQKTTTSLIFLKKFLQGLAPV